MTQTVSSVAQQVRNARSGAPLLTELVEEFLMSARARGLSERTTGAAGAYGSPLRVYFLAFCARHGITAPDQITQADLDRFTTELLERGGRRGPLSRASVNSYVKAVNQFLRWAALHGEAIAARAQAPKLQRRVLDVLSREEVEAMEDAAQTERDRLMIRLLADTGMRVGEMLALTAGDLVERDRKFYLRVVGKGRRERLVPVPALYPRLHRFATRGRQPDDPAGIFLTLRRRPGRGREVLARRGVEEMLKLVAANAGIQRRVYPHLLRHSYATWALTKGMNPIQLADLMGHSSLTMIQQVYSHLTAKDAYEAALQLLGRGN